LLEDTYTLLDFEKLLKGDEEQVGGFDLIYKGNYVKLDPKLAFTTLLGC